MIVIDVSLCCKNSAFIKISVNVCAFHHHNYVYIWYFLVCCEKNTFKDISQIDGSCIIMNNKLSKERRKSSCLSVTEKSRWFPDI